MSISKIVSGGQTGADQGFFDACIYYGLEYGGYIPKNRKSENGKIHSKYENLIELDSEDYLKRTEANVVNSDCTLIFTIGKLEGGSSKTSKLANKYKRPCFHIDLDSTDREAAAKIAAEWIRTACPDKCVLNGAGSRASKAAGIQQLVEIVMIDVLNDVNGFRVYPMHFSKPMILREKK